MDLRGGEQRFTNKGVTGRVVLIRRYLREDILGRIDGDELCVDDQNHVGVLVR